MTPQSLMHLLYFIIIGIPFIVVGLVTMYCWYMYIELRPRGERVKPTIDYSNAHPFRKR
jgi:hypothetical protein